MTREDERPRVAVIGAGYWGVNHVRNFHELGALETVCDSSRELLARIASQYEGVRIEPDFEKVLGDPRIRGLVIATPAETHCRLASAALEAGKDVLVEKPLTLDVNGGRQLVELARKCDRILMVGHLLEYHPAVIRLRGLISSGALGELRYLFEQAQPGQGSKGREYTLELCAARHRDHPATGRSRSDARSRDRRDLPAAAHSRRHDD
jgi:UDP-2-acetamido-3-amino-2,3-dideoxy-glucuronate N-acetyltransferase